MARFERLAKVELVLTGKVITSPELISRYGGKKVLCVKVENTRKSGVVDTFCVHFTNELGVVLNEGMYIEVKGDIRSVTDRDDVKDPMFVMAKTISVLKEAPKENINEVYIEDAELVTFEGVRPSHTDATKMLANYRIRLARAHSRCGYFRVTTWERDAVFLGNVHKSVKYLSLKCRLQSYVSKASGNLCFVLVTYFVEVPDLKSAKSDVQEKSAEDENNSGVSETIQDANETVQDSEDQAVQAEESSVVETADSAEENVK